MLMNRFVGLRCSVCSNSKSGPDLRKNNSIVEDRFVFTSKIRYPRGGVIILYLFCILWIGSQITIGAPSPEDLTELQTIDIKNTTTLHSEQGQEFESEDLAGSVIAPTYYYFFGWIMLQFVVGLGLYAYIAYLC